MTKLSMILALVGSVGMANAECPNACSGHGECGVFDQCSCYRNWQGNDCSERTCPFGHAHVDTPKGDLNMDGGALSAPSDPVVINSEVYPLGTTEQYPDAQTNEAHFYMECSNKGLCDRKSGECECFDGYDGTSCQRASCPGGIGGDSEQCSGHGTCHSIDYLAYYHSAANLPLSYNDQVTYNLWDAGYTRGCLCDPPFSGADCASRDCKYGVDPLYTSTGTALYQKAFVVNSCQNGDNPGTTITTNGDNHAYASSAYTASAGYLDSVKDYEGEIVLSGVVGLDWAVEGSEIIASSGLDKIGCRYKVVGADDDGTDTTLYVKKSGENSAMNADKCETTGEMADGSSYDVFHVVNTFTLLFTDHMGEVYRTAPISAAVADYSDEIKAALEGLPNNVVPSVTVTGVMVDPAGTTQAMEMAYNIEFTNNPGQLGALRIDSTPIRLGQDLQAGIECEFDQATQTADSTVYSSVGYSEIGEDTTHFADYIGNIGYYNPMTYADDGTNVLAGLENDVIYTATDLSADLSQNDVIKIQNEMYVVDTITANYIQLNTFFNGASVDGISTPIYTNDNNGVDDSLDWSLSDSSGDLVLTDMAYSLPGHDSDGTENFQPRTEGFDQTDWIRVVHSDTYEFDCLFQSSGATTAASSDEYANSYTITIDVNDDIANCPTLSDAVTAATGDITVQIYKWTPSSYTNGMYADNTRIFKKSGSAATASSAYIGIYQGGDTVGTFSDLALTTAEDTSSVFAVGDTVLYGNELNTVVATSGTDLSLLNAIAWETSAFAGVSVSGYDVDKIYKVEFDGDSSDYTYVSQCSNRGLCDGSSGLCKCFKGYTGDSCDTISELYG